MCCCGPDDGCCTTNQCCCGCTDVRTGIMVAGAVDISLLLILCIINVAFYNYGVAWWAVVILFDVFLIIGGLTQSAGWLLAWLIMSMINIVILFIGWVAWPLVYVFVFLIKFTDYRLGCTNNYYEYGQPNQTPCVKLYTDDWIIGFTTVMGISYICILVLPCYYIYLWVVVLCYRRNLIRNQIEIFA